jgi:hypothetical protein
MVVGAMLHRRDVTKEQVDLPNGPRPVFITCNRFPRPKQMVDGAKYGGQGARTAAGYFARRFGQCHEVFRTCPQNRSFTGMIPQPSL